MDRRERRGPETQRAQKELVARKKHQRMQLLILIGVVALVGITVFVILPLFKGNPAPNSQIPGYYSDTQSIKGGTAKSDVNLWAIDINKENDDMVLKLSFASGTLGERKELDSLPSYDISILTEPSRLVLHVKNLTGWDYASNPEWANNPLIAGVFKQISTSGSDGYIYFQLKQDVVYTIHEESGILNIRLRETPKVDEQKYFVLADLFDIYIDGQLPRDIYMTPALSDDNSETMISKPYNTLDEAEAFAVKVETYITNNYSDRKTEVVPLYRNKMPINDNSAINEELSNIALYKPTTGDSKPQVWAIGARFLCWMPDSDNAIFMKPLTDTALENEYGIEYCELWLHDQYGKYSQRLIDTEFAGVDIAMVSHDGAYIAFDEDEFTERTMFVYTIANGDLQNLGEKLGSYTAGYDWGNDGKLYVMAGMDDVQLMSYNPNSLAGEEIDAVEEDIGVYGSLVVIDKNVFFSDEQNSIFKYDIDAGERVNFASGALFKASPDNKMLAVLAYDEESLIDTYTAIRQVSIESGAEKTIFAGRSISDYSWSSDSRTLYFLVDNESEFDEVYLSELFAYDVASGNVSSLGLLNSVEIDTAKDPNELVFVIGYLKDEDYIPVTYKIKVK